MPALHEAKAAIESEISQVVARLNLLKLSLEHLDAVIDQADVRPQSELRRADRKPIRVDQPQTALPKTGESFWLQFMSQEPKLADEIFSSALSELAITAGSQKAKILRQRLSVILSTMTKKGVIHTEGAGRAKRYVKG